MSGPDGSGRQRAVRGDHLRNHRRLLDSALELFDMQGLGVSLREIGDRAGVSPAGIYRHFANRDHLIVEVYDEAATVLTDQAIQVLTGSRGASTQQRLDLFLDTIIAGTVQHPCYGELATHGARLYPDRPIDPVLVEEVTALLADAQDAGLLASDITGTDLVTATVPAARMLPPGAAATHTGRRVLTILRRGLTPHSQTSIPMPPAPRP